MHWEIPGSPRPIKHCHSQIQYFKAFLQLKVHFSESFFQKLGRENQGGLLFCSSALFVSLWPNIHGYISLFPCFLCHFPEVSIQKGVHLICAIFGLLERWRDCGQENRRMEKVLSSPQSAVMWPSRQQYNNFIPFHQNRISLKSKSDFWAQHSWQQTLYFVRQLLTVSLGAWREGGADWDNYKWISVHNHPRWRQLNHLLPQSSSMYLPDL